MERQTASKVQRYYGNPLLALRWEGVQSRAALTRWADMLTSATLYFTGDTVRLGTIKATVCKPGDYIILNDRGVLVCCEKETFEANYIAEREILEQQRAVA